MLCDRKSMLTNSLTVPARNTGKAVSNIFDFNIERRGSSRSRRRPDNMRCQARVLPEDRSALAIRRYPLQLPETRTAREAAR